MAYQTDSWDRALHYDRDEFPLQPGITKLARNETLPNALVGETVGIYAVPESKHYIGRPLQSSFGISRCIA
jgi:hypothetical protein